MLVISNKLYTVLSSYSQIILLGWYFHAFYSLFEVFLHFSSTNSDFYAEIHVRKKNSFQLRLPGNLSYLNSS